MNTIRNTNTHTFLIGWIEESSLLLQRVEFVEPFTASEKPRFLSGLARPLGSPVEVALDVLSGNLAALPKKIPRRLATPEKPVLLTSDSRARLIN